MESADHKQDWNHESAGLLEYSVPYLVEVLGASLSDVQECILALVHLILKQARDHIVGLIELELNLLAEDQEAQSDGTQDKNQSEDLPREVIQS